MNAELQERISRLRSAKRAIAALADTGPRFLYAPAADRVGQLAVDRYGQTWYIDAFTGLMLYPFEGHAWCGFTGGPELKAIVMALASYVRDGQLVDLALFTQACAELYGRDWPTVQTALMKLEAIAAPEGSA